MMNNSLTSTSSRPIGYWLLIGVMMIIVQIVSGGITRLTGSGLSITEWKPIVGTIPPLSESEWQQAFDKYKSIAQYSRLNSHFTLDDFKFIFFWEWFHRLWGRLLGLVFLVPFLYFVIKRKFSKTQIFPLAMLFLLGGLQGLIGWIMVKSGLNDQDLYVNHIKLAIHFIAAILLLLYTFRFALAILLPVRPKPSGRILTATIIFLLIQLIYGALMAGLKAGVFAPTWPDINGLFVPVPFWESNPKLWFSNLINDPQAVHFMHRTLAYIITVLIIWWTIRVYRYYTGTLFGFTLWFPLILVVVQVILGIFTTLNSYKAVPQGWGVFEWLAQMHQLVGIFLLLSLVLAGSLSNREGGLTREDV